MSDTNDDSTTAPMDTTEPTSSPTGKDDIDMGTAKPVTPAKKENSEEPSTRRSSRARKAPSSVYTPSLKRGTQFTGAAARMNKELQLKDQAEQKKYTSNSADGDDVQDENKVKIEKGPKLERQLFNLYKDQGKNYLKELRTIVWAKISGFPWAPAIVQPVYLECPARIKELMCTSMLDENKKDKHGICSEQMVLWLGGDRPSYNVVSRQHILAFDHEDAKVLEKGVYEVNPTFSASSKKPKKLTKAMKTKLAEAVQEAEDLVNGKLQFPLEEDPDFDAIDRLESAKVKTKSNTPGKSKAKTPAKLKTVAKSKTPANSKVPAKTPAKRSAPKSSVKKSKKAKVEKEEEEVEREEEKKPKSNSRAKKKKNAKVVEKDIGEEEEEISEEEENNNKKNNKKKKVEINVSNKRKKASAMEEEESSSGASATSAKKSKTGGNKEKNRKNKKKKGVRAANFGDESLSARIMRLGEVVRMYAGKERFNQAKVLKNLDKLTKIPVNSELLMETKIGKVVATLRKHEDKAIAKRSKEVRKLWMQAVENEMKGAADGEDSTDESAAERADEEEKEEHDAAGDADVEVKEKNVEPEHANVEIAEVLQESKVDEDTVGDEAGADPAVAASTDTPVADDAAASATDAAATDVVTVAAADAIADAVAADVGVATVAAPATDAVTGSAVDADVATDTAVADIDTGADMTDDTKTETLTSVDETQDN